MTRAVKTSDLDAARGSGSRKAREWTIEVFHDGDCPLCNREVAMLRRLDKAGKDREYFRWPLRLTA